METHSHCGERKARLALVFEAASCKERRVSEDVRDRKLWHNQNLSKFAESGQRPDTEG